MNIVLRRANLEDREVLANLLEKYDYEFSQYDSRDVNKLGLYGYKYTNGDYELIKSYPNSEYADGTLGDIFFFSNIGKFVQPAVACK